MTNEKKTRRMKRATFFISARARSVPRFFLMMSDGGFALALVSSFGNSALLSYKCATRGSLDLKKLFWLMRIESCRDLKVTKQIPLLRAFYFSSSIFSLACKSSICR